MAKVLKITGADGVNHILPLNAQTKSFWNTYNKKQPENKRVTLEEIDEKEADKLPYKDPNHVTPSQAVAMTSELKTQLADKDAEIEALKALIAAQQETDEKKSSKKTSEKTETK